MAAHQPTLPRDQFEIFITRMSHFKSLIDSRIGEFAVDFEGQVDEQFGLHSREAVQAFTSILSRGGKRIRGGLVMAAYQMFGGSDGNVAQEAALIMELVQAYLLIMDDVADRGLTRRGGPTAHVWLAEQYRERHWGTDAEHFGESIANLAAILGFHEAMSIVAQLTVPADVRSRSVDVLNRNLAVTIHGQFNDIYNQAGQTIDRHQIEQVLEWKTAYYTFVNPLQFGAILAGADDSALASLTDFGIPAGRAFQLSDDLLGIFGDEAETGKSPLDDIREGKRTLLIAEGLRRSEPAGRQYIETCLGNPQFNMSDLRRCRHILEQSGARQVIEAEVDSALKLAHSSLDQIQITANQQDIDFLAGLLNYMGQRQN